MEVIIGIVLCAMVSLGVAIYLRFFATEGARNRPFEQWCRSRPLVVAIRCRDDAAVEVYELLRRTVEPSPWFANSAGRFPWQHYVVSLDGRRASGEVVVLRVTGCRQPKLQEHRPDIAHSLELFASEAGDLIEEIWLHGQFHSVNRRVGVERENMAWLGEFDETGHLEVSAMIGQPLWLKETLERDAA